MKAKIAVIISIIIAISFLIYLIPAHGFEQLRLKEIINQGDVREAIIITPKGDEIRVKEGETLPDDSGQVVEIRQRSIIIKQSSPDGKRITLRKIALPLKPQGIKIE